MRSQHGLTLVELLVALTVVAILMAVAIPGYEDHVLRGRRTDAMTALLDIQLEQEKWRANHTTYGTLADLGLAATSPDGHYTIAITGNTATGYTATATAKSGGAQAGDSDCQTFTLTEDGPDVSTATKRRCWIQ